MYDLGVFSIKDSYNSRQDDAWIAHRLEQIAHPDHSVYHPLTSRFSFQTKDSRGCFYLFHLMARVARLFCCIVPGFLIASRTGHLVLDVLIDRCFYLHAKIKGTEVRFCQARALSQLFRTLAVAEHRISWKEQVEHQMSLPDQLCTPKAKAIYLKFYKTGLNHPALNRLLLNRAIQKTLNSITLEELNILVPTFTWFPNKDLNCGRLKEIFTRKQEELSILNLGNAI